MFKCTMSYEKIAPKDEMRRDNRVFPSSGTGTIWKNAFVTVRYEDLQGTKRAIEGRIQSAEKKTSGHKFVIDTSMEDNVDADFVVVHTNSWDGITAPVSTGKTYNHPDRLGFEAELFDASQWADLKLSGFTQVEPFDGDEADEPDKSAAREADFERRGEHRTRPRSGGLNY